MTEPTCFDLLVIGAGPAGAAAAYRGRALGLSVALIDRARFPREKLCGGGVTGRAWSHLTEVFGDVPSDLFHETSRVHLVAGAVTLGEMPEAPVIRMTMRQEFDAHLRDLAIGAGAVDFCGQRIADLDLTTNTALLANGARLRGRVIIGADGVNSPVARQVFGRSHDPAQVAFAMEVEVKGDPGPHVELDLAALPFGYGWDFPKRGGRTLGIGGRADLNPDLRATFEDWLRKRGYDPADFKIKGHHLPFGDFRRHPGRGAVLLAGDAAGLVDPVTGEGIGWAIYSGAKSADAAAEAIRMGNPLHAEHAYRQNVAFALSELGKARRWSKVIYHPWLAPRIHRLLATTPGYQRRYLQLLAGQIDYADLGVKRILKVMLRGLTRGKA